MSQIGRLALDKSPNLSGPQFPHLQTEGIGVMVSKSLVCFF